MVRVVAKINVRIEQNPGYGMLNAPRWTNLAKSLLSKGRVLRVRLSLGAPKNAGMVLVVTQNLAKV